MKEKSNCSRSFSILLAISNIFHSFKVDTSKRYSMYETSEEENTDDFSYKRKSLAEPYYLQRNKRFSETEDEGVDAGTSSSSLDEHPDNFSVQKTDLLLSNISTDDLIQLEEFLKVSGFSSSDMDEESSEENLMNLRSYVSKFLSLRINNDINKKNVSFAERVKVSPKQLDTRHFIPPNNSPNVSALLHQKLHHVSLNNFI